MFILKEIKEATKGALINADESAAVKGISTDTRAILPGELFIALKGDRFDGHNFLTVAFEKGACAAVVMDIPAPHAGKPLIKVTDTTTALGDIASFYRERLKIPIVGVTGSNGKTTTKDMIAHILSKRYSVLKTRDTENNFIGVPLTLLKIKNEPFAVIEMGTNVPGEIEYLASIARPYVGLITNIGPSHLEGLKTQKNILKEKSALFNHLEKGGYAIINADDPLLSKISATGKNNKTLTFGIKVKKADFFADDITINEDGICFNLNKRYKFTMPVLGIHNVYNALAAAAACSCLGLSIEAIQKAMADFRTDDMRFKMSRLNGINIINDAYNSNPLSMNAALETLYLLKTKGKKIVVAGDMLELGKSADKLHYEIGQSIAKSGIDVLVTVGELSVNVAKGAQENGMDNKRVRVFNEHKEAAEYLIKIAKPNDTILIKGSRAMKMEEVITCFTTYYTR